MYTVLEFSESLKIIYMYKKPLALIQRWLLLRGVVYKPLIQDLHVCLPGLYMPQLAFLHAGMVVEVTLYHIIKIHDSYRSSCCAYLLSTLVVFPGGESQQTSLGAAAREGDMRMAVVSYVWAFRTSRTTSPDGYALYGRREGEYLYDHNYCQLGS